MLSDCKSSGACSRSRRHTDHTTDKIYRSLFDELLYAFMAIFLFLVFIVIQFLYFSDNLIEAFYRWEIPVRNINRLFRQLLLCSHRSGLAPYRLPLLSALILCLISLCPIASASRPDDNQLLIGNAGAAYSIGDYQKCIEYYAAAINQGSTGKDIYYNAACCCALNGDTDLAVEYLAKAIENGYQNAEWLKQDSDLQSLREDARWSDMLQKCKTAEEAYLQSINQELYRAFQADQADRLNGETDWSVVHLRDCERRQLAMSMLDSGLINTSDDYFHAAMIFQHGDDSSDYWRAHELAIKAVELDSTNNIAKWLAAAAKDRYLWKIGKPQIYGTQYHPIDGVWTIEPIDTTAVSDEERLRWQVPPLSEARLKAMQMNEANGQR